MERLHAATVSPSRSLAVATAELPLRVLPDMAGVAAPRKDSAFGTCRIPLGDAQPAGMPPPPPLQPAASRQPPAASQANAKGEELRMQYVRLVRPPSTAATLHCCRQSPPISAHLRAARAAPHHPSLSASLAATRCATRSKRCAARSCCYATDSRATISTKSSPAGQTPT
jgi:hypothetical protein